MTRDSRALGQAKTAASARSEYMDFCKGTIPSGMGFEDFKIVVDASHGAAYKVAPRVMSDLGADVVPVGCSPNGRNINDNCGSTRPDLLKLTVTGVRAHVGMALDGDGDRVVMVDERGNLVDGDQLLYVLARDRLESKTLVGPVVGTVMTNLGLELALRERGVEFLRAKVGDRHVLQLLKEHGGVLGGETSGHLLCLDRTTTGDGLVTALQVLAVMQRTGLKLSELTRGMEQFPQVLLNVKIRPAREPERRPADPRRGRGGGVGARRARSCGAARVRNRAGDPHHGRGRGSAAGRHRRESARRHGPGDVRGRLGRRCLARRRRKPPSETCG